MTLPRVLFVTGKGGTGKSTVAAALAIALSRRRPTTLADLDRRLSAATALGAIPPDSTAVKVSDTLDVIALTPRDASPSPAASANPPVSATIAAARRPTKVNDCAIRPPFFSSSA